MNRAIIKMINDQIKKFDIVFLVMHDNYEHIIQLLMKHTLKHVLIICQHEFENNGNISFYRCTEKEAQDIRKVFFTYEFTDNFYIISDDNNYGSIMNYVKNGIITEEEAMKALLD